MLSRLLLAVDRRITQAVWLLAKGHSTADVAEIVALTPRWVNKLARRCETDGADALGDRRRGNRGARPLLDEADLEALRERLAGDHPEAWARIQSRREFMREALGIELHPDVLPFSNIPAFLPPFLLRADRAMTIAS